MKRPKKDMGRRLANDTWTIGIHGVTGQGVAARPMLATGGTLAAGTLVRKIATTDTPDGRLTTFQATDDGRTWYRHETFADIQLTRAERMILK